MTGLLFPANETGFTTNGLGSLQGATIKVSEKLNGEFCLDMTYPAAGKHFADIIPGNYVLTTTGPEKGLQAFKIETVIKKSDQKIEIRANHIGYELNGIPVRPFTAKGITATFAGLKANSMIENPFAFETDITNEQSEYNQITPQSCRACLGGVAGSVLDVFGGEYEWNMTTVRLLKRRGKDNGVTIRYGKNLISLQQEKAIAGVFTGVVCFWESDEQVSTGEIQYIQNHESYPKQRVLVYDASGDFDEQPTLSQLNQRAQTYISENKIGEPKINLEVSYIDLSTVENYRGKIPAQAIALGDTVTVHFDYLGIDVTARVIETVWNVNANRYDSITIGSPKASLAQTLYDTQEQSARNASRIVSVVQKVDREIGEINQVISAVQEDVSGVKNDVSRIDQTADEIAQTVTNIQKDYVTEEGVENILNGKEYVTQSTLEQTAGDITAKFTEIEQTAGENKDEIARIETYIKMDSSGVTVGKNESDIRGVFGNESLDFIDSSGTKLAWLSTGEGLGATEVTIGDATTKNKRWRLIVSADGSHFRITRHS